MSTFERLANAAPRTGRGALSSLLVLPVLWVGCNCGGASGPGSRTAEEDRAERPAEGVDAPPDDELARFASPRELRAFLEALPTRPGLQGQTAGPAAADAPASCARGGCRPTSSPSRSATGT